MANPNPFYPTNEWEKIKSSMDLSKKAVLSISSLDDQKVALDAVTVKELAGNSNAYWESGNGHTGFAIAAALKAPFVVFRSEKNQNESVKVLKNHLTNNGLLVITGHGGEGGSEINGAYVTLQNPHAAKKAPLTEIDREPHEIVNLAIKAGLKSGDQITILLGICHGASTVKGEDSFAHKLARKFAKKGISTAIIASDTTVKRFGCNAITSGKITFAPEVGMAAKDVNVFITKAINSTEDPDIRVYRIAETIELSSTGINFVQNPWHEKAKKMFWQYQGTPLVGLINKQTSEIVLAPCITPKVNLGLDNQGKALTGYLINDNLEKIRDCTKEEIEQFNLLLQQGCVPRVDMGGKTSHEFLFEQNQLKNKSDWGGFAVTLEPSGAVNYAFVSGAFNSPLNQRVKGALLEQRLQDQVKKQIENYKAELDGEKAYYFNLLKKSNYFISLDKNDATRFLEAHGKVGDTIIRKSSIENHFAITKKGEDGISHGLISISSAGFNIKGNDESYSTLEELITSLANMEGVEKILTSKDYQNSSAKPSPKTPFGRRKCEINLINYDGDLVPSFASHSELENYFRINGYEVKTEKGQTILYTKKYSEEEQAQRDMGQGLHPGHDLKDFFGLVKKVNNEKNSPYYFELSKNTKAKLPELIDFLDEETQAALNQAFELGQRKERKNDKGKGQKGKFSTCEEGSSNGVVKSKRGKGDSTAVRPMDRLRKKQWEITSQEWSSLIKDPKVDWNKNGAEILLGLLEATGRIEGAISEKKKIAKEYFNSILPKITDVHEVIKLVALIENKKDKFKYLRQEQSRLRLLSYGETKTWSNMVKDIKDRLDFLLTRNSSEKYTKEERSNLNTIMSAHRGRGIGKVTHSKISYQLNECSEKEQGPTSTTSRRN